VWVDSVRSILQNGNRRRTDFVVVRLIREFLFMTGGLPAECHDHEKECTFALLDLTFTTWKAGMGG
jgi:hypothetical protein